MSGTSGTSRAAAGAIAVPLDSEQSFSLGFHASRDDGSGLRGRPRRRLRWGLRRGTLPADLAATICGAPSASIVRAERRPRHRNDRSGAIMNIVVIDDEPSRWSCSSVWRCSSDVLLEFGGGSRDLEDELAVRGLVVELAAEDPELRLGGGGGSR
jgi:hypothetical protein